LQEQYRRGCNFRQPSAEPKSHRFGVGGLQIQPYCEGPIVDIRCSAFFKKRSPPRAGFASRFPAQPETDRRGASCLGGTVRLGARKGFDGPVLMQLPGTFHHDPRLVPQCELKLGSYIVLAEDPHDCGRDERKILRTFGVDVRCERECFVDNIDELSCDSQDLTLQSVLSDRPFS
jgi:hypothetical protein